MERHAESTPRAQAHLPWVPILDGAVGEEAARSVREVAEALSAPEWSPESLHYSVAGGNAGLAIFFNETHHVLGASIDALRRDERWDRAADQLAEAEWAQPSLYGGYSGMGWATAFLLSDNLSRPETEGDLDDTYEELEGAVLGALEARTDPSDYDLISGPVGWGLFSLERWPHPRARRALEMIVDFLQRTSQRVPEGVRWWTPPDLLPEWQREENPKGYYNLGLAHGIPAIWVLLAQTITRGIRPEISSSLLEGSVDWVLAQRLENGDGLAFPGLVSLTKPATPSRLAWCYGDLGLAGALLVAARCLSHERWEAEALSIARNAAQVTPERSSVKDTGLCHGSAGVGHIFNRMYQTTGDEVLKEAAKFWLARTLEMRLTSDAVAGYSSWRPKSLERGAPLAWHPTAGLLEGATGSALALLGGIGNREAAWDRFLFLSPVPRG